MGGGGGAGAGAEGACSHGICCSAPRPGSSAFHPSPASPACQPAHYPLPPLPPYLPCHQTTVPLPQPRPRPQVYRVLGPLAVRAADPIPLSQFTQKVCDALLPVLERQQEPVGAPQRVW